MTRNVQLRAFLRARRGEIRPESAGIKVQGPRRVPGLRREEVAMLAGVSVDYYVRLEQGREITPSDSVLDAIAEVLALSATQREQLFTLVRGATAVEAPLQAPDPNVISLLSSIDLPALVTGHGTRILGANKLVRALLNDFHREPSERRYFADWVFLDPVAPLLLGEWDWAARQTAGIVRAAATQYPGDARLQSLVGRISEGSEMFRALWAGHDVDTYRSGHKRFVHPAVGEMKVFHQAMALANGQWLFLYWTERDTDSRARLTRLQDWADSHIEDAPVSLDW